MTEFPPSTPETSRYRSPRDAVLHSMAMNGWANESAGEAPSPTGWFARISNEPREMHEIVDVFEVDINQAGIDPQELVGHYLLVEAGEDVNVLEYGSPQALQSEYRELLDAYLTWSDSQL